MIIDSHVHIGALSGRNLLPELLLRSMEEYGIDYALVSCGEAVEFDEEGQPFSADRRRDQYAANLPAVGMAREHPGSIGVSVWCMPRTEGLDYRFLQLLEDGRDVIKGLKFHPYHSRIPMTDPSVRPYLALAEERGLPVSVHTAGDEWSACRFAYEAAKEFPAVNFIMVHMGLLTDNAEAVELIGALPNLYGDTTWVRPEAALRLVKEYGAQKLLFGTDSPIDGIDTYAHPFYRTYFGEFKDWVSAEEYEAIMHGNAARLFNIYSNPSK